MDHISKNGLFRPLAVIFVLKRYRRGQQEHDSCALNGFDNVECSVGIIISTFAMLSRYFAQTTNEQIIKFAEKRGILGGAAPWRAFHVGGARSNVTKMKEGTLLFPTRQKSPFGDLWFSRKIASKLRIN